MGAFDSLEVDVRLNIKRPGSESNSVFGPGIARLCAGVRDNGSLYAAARSMGMAYSKAWRIMKDTEAALGFQLLDRDGAHGSSLTEDGKALLEAYLSMERELSDDAKRLFAVKRS